MVTTLRLVTLTDAHRPELLATMRDPEMLRFTRTPRPDARGWLDGWLPVRRLRSRAWATEPSETACDDAVGIQRIPLPTRVQRFAPLLNVSERCRASAGCARIACVPARDPDHSRPESGLLSSGQG